jgi:carboxyl-terminal processing protease
VGLISQFKIFDYATYFNNTRTTIAPPEEFTITPEIYADFAAFLKKDDFKYESETEEAMDELIKTAKREKYYDFSKDEFAKLQEKLGHNLDKDLEQFQDEVKELLTDEIISRYYYQKGAIKASLKDDKNIQKAIEILKNQPEYAGIFKPGKEIKLK